MPPEQQPIKVLRSEERLSTTTVRTATERVRIRKVIVTEERTITVQLRREELVLEREPFDGSAVGNEDPPAPITFVLHEEQPVITTEVVPVERVSIIVDQIVQLQSVSDSVRKERIEVQRTAQNTLGPTPVE